MARIACLGAALQDVYLKDHDDLTEKKVDGHTYFDRLELGKKVDIDRVIFSTGGGATNAATTFARAGHEAIFLGSIARDPAGEAILAALDKEGIDTSYIHYFRGAMHTGYSVLLLAPSGERTILTYRGASARFDMLDEKDLELICPDWLYATTTRGDIETLGKFFAMAKKTNARVMYNPGVMELAEPKKLMRVLKDVDILLLNKAEAQELVPGVLLEELLARLLNMVPGAIITNGVMGAIASYEGKTYRVGLYEDVKIVDSTGAGDAFGSGLLAALATGKNFHDALVFASANSTNVVTKVGAKGGILSLGETKLHAMPIQEVR